MSLDEAISHSVRLNLSPPTLRLYQWTEFSVTIGRFQSSSAPLNIESGKNGYPVIRRITGGSAMLHGRDLSYSCTASTDLAPFSGGLSKNYMTLSSVLAEALRTAGIENSIASERPRATGSPWCHATLSYGDILVNGNKCVGSAQKRYRGYFFQHGSVFPPYVMNGKEIDSLSGSGEIRIGCGETECKKVYNVTVADLKNAIKISFENLIHMRLITEDPSDFELSLAQKLRDEKYSARGWNFLIP